MRTLQAHTGADVEAGRVGHRNGEVPLDYEEEDAPDIRLQPPAKKQGHATQKDTRAGAEPAKRKRAAAPVAAAPAAAGGLAAFGFGGAAKPASKRLPKRRAASKKPAAKPTVQPGLATTEDGQIANTTALWGIGATYADSDVEGDENHLAPWGTAPTIDRCESRRRLSIASWDWTASPSTHSQT